MNSCAKILRIAMQAGILVLCGTAAAQDGLCDFLAAELRTEWDVCKARFELAGDVNGDGVPEGAMLSLIHEAACGDEKAPRRVAIVDAFDQNLVQLNLEEDAGMVQDVQNVLAGLFLAGDTTQATMRQVLAANAIETTGGYVIVACDETGDCVLTDDPTPGELQFTGGADLDGDGLTNAEEFAATVGAGGTLAEFIEAATTPALVDEGCSSGSSNLAHSGGDTLILLFAIAALTVHTRVAKHVKKKGAALAVSNDCRASHVLKSNQEYKKVQKS